ncbi:hypothetical protein [Paenibacillus sp. JNUCC31]|uniref:hypothetical protein n=1 Tax=Paenibacillus sp. JNUCC-31 TaxID=2777983 RepID=UPI001E4A1CC7|nr:hypothetical protein [Paenibacillus sp. JNUCC-31]
MNIYNSLEVTHPPDHFPDSLFDYAFIFFLGSIVGQQTQVSSMAAWTLHRSEIEACSLQSLSRIYSIFE